MHGGLSTGPRTEAGKAKARRARWLHGYYSEEAKAERRKARAEREQTAMLVHLLNRLEPEQVERLIRTGAL